jgi:hypothetical protein
LALKPGVTDGESGEPGRSSLAAPEPISPEDLGAGIALPREVLPVIPRLAPRTTKSRSGPLASSTLIAPRYGPSTLGCFRTCASCKRVALLPSYTSLTNTSCTYGSDASSAFDANSSSTSVSRGVPAGHK